MDDLKVIDDLASLLRRCAARDGHAFRDVYDKCGPQLYAVALRITREPALAADALHDALLQVWRNAERFDAARGRPQAWLVSLVRYRALDLVRRRRREVTGMELPEGEDESPDALSLLMQSAEARALRRCLETLDAEKRRLVTTAFLDGYSHSELAARLNMPLGTVKSSIRRGLESLKRCLDS